MLILASQSPTRKTLLNNAGLRFTAVVAPIDERETEQTALTRDPNRAALARTLAEAKALAVSQSRPEAMVIGADQTLDFGGHDVHKPVSRAQAANQLMAMAGTSHTLHSGVALARAGQIVWSTVGTATLRFKPFSRQTLDAVLDLEGDAILGSVGAYRLEGPSIRLFSAIEGDYFTILGLPMLALLDALERYAPEVF